MKARQGDRGNWLEKKKMKRGSQSGPHRKMSPGIGSLLECFCRDGVKKVRVMVCTMCGATFSSRNVRWTWGISRRPGWTERKKNTLMCIWILVYAYWCYLCAGSAAAKNVLKVLLLFFPLGFQPKATLAAVRAGRAHSGVSPLENEKKKKEDHIFFFYDDCSRSTLDECGK